MMLDDLSSVKLVFVFVHVSRGTSKNQSTICCCFCRWVPDWKMSVIRCLWCIGLHVGSIFVPDERKPFHQLIDRLNAAAFGEFQL